MALVSMVDESDQMTGTSKSDPFGEEDGILGKVEEIFIGKNDSSLVETKVSPTGSADTSCPISDDLTVDGQSSIKSYGPKYPWKPEQKQWIFSAFFWTYVVFQIPAARLAERFGPKWILLTAALGTSLLSFASPWAASLHVYALALVRALMGICQAAAYPACFVLYAKWLPPVERSLAIPILAVGAYIGSIITSSLTGYFSEQEQFGWPYAFYTPGVLCAIWFVLWLLFGANEPSQHKSISLEEISYIESKLERSTGAAGLTGSKLAISWVKLAKSQSIWAMVVGFFASNWSFSVVLMLIPSYLNDILHIPPFKNGLINSTIYALFCIASPIVGSCSTLMIETRAFGLSRLNIRKMFQCVALFGQAACFLALPFIGCDKFWVLGILFLQIILFSFTNGGEVHLATELSVDFSGTIYAIANCVGSSTGVIVPSLFAFVVKNGHNFEQWSIFFYIAAAISAFGGLVFLIFAQNHLQDFSKNVGESRINICHETSTIIPKGTRVFSLAGSTITDQRRATSQDTPVEMVQQHYNSSINNW